MRIFALETNAEVLKREFIAAGEEAMFMTRYHWFSFLFAVVRDVCVTVVLIAVGVAAVAWAGAPTGWTIGVLTVAWFSLVFFHLLKVYIDWAYDFILVTTDKILYVDQSSVFHREIRPINVESVGGVSTRTQFWNVFPFGILTVYLKQGVGGGVITKKYVPRAQEVSAKISEVVTRYQRYDHSPDAQ